MQILRFIPARRWFSLLVFLMPGACVLRAATPPSQGTDQGTLVSRESIEKTQTQAEAGDAAAQESLGRAYEKGSGVPQNFGKAVAWYRKAAEQGNADGAADLGVMYRLGLGVDKNLEESVRWHRKSAKQQNPIAMFNLAASYFNGEGVPTDDVLAYAWFLLAEKAGSNPAKDGVQRLTASLRNAERAEAFQRIAEMYENGEELPQNYSEAASWYGKAADAGSLSSGVRLASLLLVSKSVPADYERARDLCKRAAEKNYPPAMFCLGVIYEQGQGLAADQVAAAKWFTRAADGQFAPAVYHLARLYLKGQGVKQNKVTAYTYFLLLANPSQEIEAERAQLKAELSPKELEKAKKDATEWSRKHPPLGLVTHH